MPGEFLTFRVANRAATIPQIITRNASHLRAPNRIKAKLLGICMSIQTSQFHDPAIYYEESSAFPENSWGHQKVHVIATHHSQSGQSNERQSKFACLEQRVAQEKNTTSNAILCSSQVETGIQLKGCKSQVCPGTENGTRCEIFDYVHH